MMIKCQNIAECNNKYYLVTKVTNISICQIRNTIYMFQMVMFVNVVQYYTKSFENKVVCQTAVIFKEVKKTNCVN